MIVKGHNFPPSTSKSLEFAWTFSANHSCLGVGNDMEQQVIFILGFDSHLQQSTFDNPYPILDRESLWKDFLFLARV